MTFTFSALLAHQPPLTIRGELVNLYLMHSGDGHQVYTETCRRKPVFLGTGVQPEDRRNDTTFSMIIY